MRVQLYAFERDRMRRTFVHAQWVVDHCSVHGLTIHEDAEGIAIQLQQGQVAYMDGDRLYICERTQDPMGKEVILDDIPLSYARGDS